MVRLKLLQSLKKGAVRNILNARVQRDFDVGAVARIHLKFRLQRLPLALAEVLHPPKAVLAAQHLVERGFKARLRVGAPVANGALGQHAHRHQAGVALLGDESALERPALEERKIFNFSVKAES